MNIRLSLDATGVSRMTRRLWADQIPYARSVAINETAKRFQRQQTEHIERVFTIRRPMFAKRAVKISPFAKKHTPFAIVKIEPPGGAKRADIFSKFEEGGTKRARDGGRLAIPDAARRGKTGVITKGQRPKAFNFELRGSGPKGTVYVGDKNTFMIRRPDGSGGIFQRMGRSGAQGRNERGQFLGSTRKRSGAVRMLYGFSRTAKIDDRLEFADRAKSIVQKAWRTEFGKAFEQATRTARR